MNESEDQPPDTAMPANGTAVDPPATPLDLAASSLCCVIQLLPDDGDSAGRLASVAVKATQAARPTFHPALIRLKLSDLPPVMLALLERHRQSATLSPPVHAPSPASGTPPRLAARRRKVDLNAAPAAALVPAPATAVPHPTPATQPEAQPIATSAVTPVTTSPGNGNDGPADVDTAAQASAPTQFSLFDL